VPDPAPAVAALLLPYRVAPGELQMAIDGALLRWVAASPGRLVARTYGWSRPTLSLGRVEPWPAGWDTGALARDGIDVARRPTGGDAVLHDEEATFAVAASVPGPWAEAPRAFAERVADAVAAAYRTFHLAAERIRAEERGPALPAGATPCFARSSPGEVRVGAFKLAGIASKFTRGGALSHASLPLTSRHRDVARYRSDAPAAAALLEGHARSAGELLGAPLAASLLNQRIVEGLSVAFGVDFRDASFDAIGLSDPADTGTPAGPGDSGAESAR
jgi:lipoate-protein ligase A